MKRFISLSVSLLLTLLLAAGMFSVTALAEPAFSMPTEATIEYGTTSTEITGTYSGLTSDKFELGGTTEWELKNDNGDTLPFRVWWSPQNLEEDTTGEMKATVEIDSYYWTEAEKGTTYTGELGWHIIDRSQGTEWLVYEKIMLTVVIPGEDDSSEESSEPEESSEESSEPEESSEAPAESISDTEGSSTAEEESSTTEEESSAAEEESSAAESESESKSESSQSSKTSKTSNPGKPDELNMGGSVGASDGGKPAPDTGMSYAPLAALGVAAMAGLAVLAFRKK